MLHKSLTLFILFSALHSYAQELIQTTFIASVNFTTIGTEEELLISFTFTGAELKGFEKPDFEHFYIESGPNQSRSESRTQIDGKPVHTISTRMQYVIKPQAAGHFTIGRASVTTEDGRVYHTDPININVVKGKAINDGYGNYRSLTNDMLDFSGDIMRMKASWVVATGPLYYHAWTKERKTPVQLLKDIKARIGSMTRTEDIGIYLWDSATPRIYIGVEDTTGIKTLLEKLYAGYGDGQYYTKADTKGSFIFGEQPRQLVQLKYYYLGFERLKPWLASAGRDTLQPRRLIFTWMLNRKENAAAFSERIKKEGYAIDSTSGEVMKSERPVTFYYYKVSKTTEVNDAVLQYIADELLDIAEAYGASFSGMEVEKDKK